MSINQSVINKACIETDDWRMWPMHALCYKMSDISSYAFVMLTHNICKLEVFAIQREIPILRRLHSELWGGSVWWWTPFLISQSGQLRSSSSNTIQCSLYFQLYCNSVDVCIGTLLISIWTVGGERHRIGADTGRCSPKINCFLWPSNAKSEMLISYQSWFLIRYFQNDFLAGTNSVGTCTFYANPCLCFDENWGDILNIIIIFTVSIKVASPMSPIKEPMGAQFMLQVIVMLFDKESHDNNWTANDNNYKWRQ